MRASLSSVVIAGVVAVALSPAAGCDSQQPKQSTYFERTIAPILTTSCVRTNTGAGCHVSDPKGNAFGNLDVSSFDGVNHRRDLLTDYGPYGQPAMLVKNIPPQQLAITTFDGQKVTITTDIKHAGGAVLDPTASAYQVLRRWIENGATENNAGVPPTNIQRQPCNSDVPTGIAGFDPSKDPTTPDFATFRDRVNGVLGGTCAAGNCHGTQANDLYLTCGKSPEQIRWNYFSASDYIAQQPPASEIVRRPLAPAQGGAFHEGGTIFGSTSDSDYQAILDWATQHGPSQAIGATPEFQFFAHKVQPMFVKKGCLMMQCHSASMFHDYRMRGGSGGSFSLSATRRNYQLSLVQVSLESEDPNASRMVRKNLYRPDLRDGGTGLLHRGGPLFEDFGMQNASPAACAKGNSDYDNGDLDKIPAYCVVAEWLKRERAARNLAPLSAVVYVKRKIAPGPDRAQDFDVYAGGADLRIAKVTLDALGNLTAGADTSATFGCGLDPNTADIKRPAVSWDGKKIAFAARASATEPLQVYEMNADGTGCAKHADVNAGPTNGNGILIHNFDPSYSPPDSSGVSHLVFASTRGNAQSPSFDYSGPQKTPADVTKPNANLYAVDAPGQIRQLTYGLNMERRPSFMADGRIIMTAEKREPGFYQLALRRINFDGGDYHPLYGQRGSIGYHQADQVVELLDKDFAAIFSDKDAPHGGGALGVFNRSIGVDYTSTDPKDYLIDTSAIDPNGPTTPEPNFFLHSLRFPDGSVSGHIGGQTTGLYTTPAPLPGGKILVSFGAGTDVASFGGDYDVYVLDPSTGAKTKLLGAAGSAEIEAVAVFERGGRDFFTSRLDEPNGHTKIVPGHTESDIVVLDMPMLGTLLFQNTPTGRILETDLSSFEIWEELPPPTDAQSPSGDNAFKDDFGTMFVKRRLLGKVPIDNDGSAHLKIPGGMPFLIHLPDTSLSRKNALPRWQKETMQFYPGEYSHQSFKRQFFSGFCGQCHGAVSGRPLDVAVQPDVLTQASQVSARNVDPVDLNRSPGERGTAQGAPTGP